MSSMRCEYWYHSCSEMIGYLLTWCIYASVNFYLSGTFESGHIPHVLGPKGPVFHSGVNGLAFYLFLLLHFISTFFLGRISMWLDEASQRVAGSHTNRASRLPPALAP